MITGRNFEVSNFVLFNVIKWFAAYNLVINLDKMDIMKFKTENLSHSTLHIGYKEEYRQ